MLGSLNALSLRQFPGSVLSGLHGQTVGATLDSLRAQTDAASELGFQTRTGQTGSSAVIGHSSLLSAGAAVASGEPWNVSQGVPAAAANVPGGIRTGAPGHTHPHFLPGNVPGLGGMKAGVTGTPIPAAAVPPQAPRTQPLMIPPSQGFPPRSLHAYIPSLSGNAAASQLLPARAALLSSQVPRGGVVPPISGPPPSYMAATRGGVATPSSAALASRPLTRFQARSQQQKLEQERRQAITKVLQSSEEARIAFRSAPQYTFTAVCACHTCTTAACV